MLRQPHLQLADAAAQPRVLAQELLPVTLLVALAALPELALLARRARAREISAPRIPVLPTRALTLCFSIPICFANVLN